MNITGQSVVLFVALVWEINPEKMFRCWLDICGDVRLNVCVSAVTMPVSNQD